MILYIAEKPSLGRAIAEALPGPLKKGDGYIQVGNGDLVSWCIGHLLEQAEPDAYDPGFKQWRLEHLPILPERWQLTPKPKTRGQLAVLRRLVKQADQLVHAGDPDREGQLLVDEVIDYLKVPAKKRQGMQRCLISDLNKPAVQRALARLRNNQEFVPLSTSALARSRADWLYGINLTRAYTLQGRRVGYTGVLSVGRVQTPVLGLVVRRDREIEQFQSRPFYEVLAHLRSPDGSGEPIAFPAKWCPSEACRPYQDEEGRVLSRALAENVVKRITGKPAEVTLVEKKPKREAPPLPFNLSALQIEAARRHGFSAQQVLDLCQALYERHKLITYPRSDSRYLPVEQLAQAPQILAALSAFGEPLATAAAGTDSRRKSKAWNDARVDAHHAIIPTGRPAGGGLSGAERTIYELIARQYLYQFYPDFSYDETRVEVEIEGGRFLAKARQVREQGWKAILPSGRDTAGEQPAQTLPALSKGQALLCERGELLEKQTQPPKPFTDATLLAAMTGIARFVTDATLRQVLKDTDGLGTEATRAGIIELLFRRGFLARHGKQIRSTEAGRGLIDSLPESATLPDMTAQWEAQLEAITQKAKSYDDFMTPLIDTLRGLVDQAVTTLPESLQGVPATAARSRKGRTGKTRTGGRRRRQPGGATGKVMQ